MFIIETYTLAYQLFLVSYIFYRLGGFTNRYLIHLFQGLKCLPLPIIETYSLWTYTCISVGNDRSPTRQRRVEITGGE